jgi:hypothetical protein
MPARIWQLVQVLPPSATVTHLVRLAVAARAPAPARSGSVRVAYFNEGMEGFLGQPNFGTQAIAYAIRSERAGSATLVNEVRQAVWSVNGDLPVLLVRAMQDLYAASLERTSFTLVMLAIAGAMALGLGLVGIASVMAYVVSQRRREIGIRLSLSVRDTLMPVVARTRVVARSPRMTALGSILLV